MNRPVRTKTPGGEDIVILPASEFERLVELAEDARDIRDAEEALAEIAAGNVELLSHAEVQAFLDSPSAIAFWRKRRGMTQSALASRAGITQAYLAQVEGGKRTGDVQLYRRLANVLSVDVEIILPEAEGAKGGRRKSRKRRK
jgi:DNA-binding XRE family transcriptional regulator